MSIGKSMLQIPKSLDEQVLRQYTKLALKWEKKGRSVYTLSSIFGLPSKFLIITGVESLTGSTELSVGTEIAFYNWDCAYNLVGLTGTIREDKTGDAIAANPFLYLYRKINRAVRLPTLIAGVGLLGKGIYEAANQFITGQPMDPSSIDCLVLGAGLFGVSSSQYIKDRNPKLLEKEPLLKKLYNWAKETIDSLMPDFGPQPQPIPISINTPGRRRYYSEGKSLDNYVQK